MSTISYYSFIFLILFPKIIIGKTLQTQRIFDVFGTLSLCCAMLCFCCQWLSSVLTVINSRKSVWRVGQFSINCDRCHDSTIQGKYFLWFRLATVGTKEYIQCAQACAVIIVLVVGT